MQCSIHWPSLFSHFMWKLEILLCRNTENSFSISFHCHNSEVGCLHCSCCNQCWSGQLVVDRTPLSDMPSGNMQTRPTWSWKHATWAMIQSFEMGSFGWRYLHYIHMSIWWSDMLCIRKFRTSRWVVAVYNFWSHDRSSFDAEMERT